jgi:hypothetical protein
VSYDEAHIIIALSAFINFEYQLRPFILRKITAIGDKNKVHHALNICKENIKLKGQVQIERLFYQIANITSDYTAGSP